MDAIQTVYGAYLFWGRGYPTGQTLIRNNNGAALLAATRSASTKYMRRRPFRGDTARWYPEELFLAALSLDLKSRFLDCCAERDISVISHVTDAHGVATSQGENGARCFSKIVVRSTTTLRFERDIRAAADIHIGVRKTSIAGFVIMIPTEHISSYFATSRPD